MSVVETSEKSCRQGVGSQGQAIWRDRLIGKASIITNSLGPPDAGHKGSFENQRYLFQAKCTCPKQRKNRER